MFLADCNGTIPAAKCTIIIPVHNRQVYLPRLTEYLADYSGPIYITDSSPSPAPREYIRARHAQYVHVPGMPYVQKMQAACIAVTTPYVTDCPDDDFIIKGSIADAVQIMEADGNIASVRGRTIRMSGKRAQIFLRQEWARHAKNVLLNKPEHGAIRQLVGIMRWAVAMNHVVYRRPALLRAYSLFVSHPHLRPILFIDRIVRYVAVCCGGIKFIPRPMAVRDEDRLFYRPGELPADIEISVPYSELPGRLRNIGDPLAKMMAESGGIADIRKLEAFNQKIFSRNFDPTIDFAPPWLGSRMPIELLPEYQGEVDDILKIVRRHRSLPHTAIGTYLNVRNYLGRMRRRLAAPS